MTTCLRCGEPFCLRQGTRFCGPDCRWAHRYWSDPEAVRARMRAYRKRLKEGRACPAASSAAS